MSWIEHIRMLTQYKSWADETTYSSLSLVAEDELTKQRQTHFGSITHTLNHVYVIDAVFKAHLLGESHGYTARNTEDSPALAELWPLQQEMNDWYVDYAKALAEADLSQVLHFKFIGGGEGSMSRVDMITHVVNHSTYHRGFVGDMMYQIPASPPANDLPVFLRDAYHAD